MYWNLVSQNWIASPSHPPLLPPHMWKGERMPWGCHMIAHHWIDSILGRLHQSKQLPEIMRRNPLTSPWKHTNTTTQKKPTFCTTNRHQQSFYWDLSMEICLKGIPCGIVHELAATAISYISHLCLDANSWKHCQEAWQEILVSLLHLKPLYTKSPQSLPTAKDLMALLNRGNQKG